MWMITTRGFYSAVEHRDEAHRIIVRARSRGDLERLLELPVIDGEIEESARADYPVRVTVSRMEWVRTVALLASGIDYPNFKNAVHERMEFGDERAGTYLRVWRALIEIEREGRIVEDWWWPTLPFGDMEAVDAPDIADVLIDDDEVLREEMRDPEFRRRWLDRLNADTRELQARARRAFELLPEGEVATGEAADLVNALERSDDVEDRP